MATIEIPDDLLVRLRDEAALQGVDLEAYIRKALTDRLLHDRDKRLGIAKPAR